MAISDSKEKSLLLFIVILLLINTGATLAGSYLLRPIINNYILPHNIPGLIRMIFLLLSIYLLGSTCCNLAKQADDLSGSENG
jgi:ATP-binding cassette subfamily B multidrug efflux pump